MTYPKEIYWEIQKALLTMEIVYSGKNPNDVFINESDTVEKSLLRAAVRDLVNGFKIP